MTATRRISTKSRSAASTSPKPGIKSSPINWLPGTRLLPSSRMIPSSRRWSIRKRLGSGEPQPTCRQTTSTATRYRQPTSTSSANQAAGQPERRTELAPSRRLGWCAEGLLEERQGPLPGEIGRRLVVARRAGVVVEGALRARIDVDRVLLVVGLQRRLVGGDAGIHRVVVFGVVQEERRLDVGHLGGGNLPAVVGHAGVELRAGGCQAIDHQAAETEANRPHLAGGFRMALEERHCRP